MRTEESNTNELVDAAFELSERRSALARARSTPNMSVVLEAGAATAEEHAAYRGFMDWYCAKIIAEASSGE